VKGADNRGECWAHWGMARGIERHNFLILRISHERIKRFPYHGRVVDLGCGSAHYKETVLRTADEYIGVDWKNSMHDQSRVNVFADFTKPLPFPDAYADTVISFYVLEHLPEPGFFLLECNRILRPGGMLCMIVPFLWHLHEEPYDYYRYTRYGLQYLLEKSGFSEIVIEAQTGFWQTWWLRFNYHTLSLARGPLKYFWYPVWWLTQIVAPLMDRINPGRGEHTSLYSVQAKKM
jgi:SAM-dependent methyltransferase